MGIFGNFPMIDCIIVCNVTKMYGSTNIFFADIIMNPFRFFCIGIIFSFWALGIILRIGNQYDRKRLTVVAACIFAGSLCTIAGLPGTAGRCVSPGHASLTIFTAGLYDIIFASLLAFGAVVAAFACFGFEIARLTITAGDGDDPLETARIIGICTFGNSLIRTFDFSC